MVEVECLFGPVDCAAQMSLAGYYLVEDPVWRLILFVVAPVWHNNQMFKQHHNLIEINARYKYKKIELKHEINWPILC